MITKDMSILEVLQRYPQAWQILVHHGMGCVQCMGAMEETIENGARMHDIDLKELLKDLNKLLVING